MRYYIMKYIRITKNHVFVVAAAPTTKSLVEEQHTNCREQATLCEGLSLVPWILSVLMN